MNRIKLFFEKLFRGCYGIDSLGKLNIGLIIVFLVLLNVGYATGATVFTNVVRIFYILLIVVFFFRLLSKNTAKRLSENNVYIKLKKGVVGEFKLLKDRIRDRKSFIYRHCPKCRAVLRLKRIGGKHRAVCPKCGNSFDVSVR